MTGTYFEIRHFRTGNINTNKKNVENWEYVVDSIIQATKIVDFEDGLRTGVLLRGYVAISVTALSPGDQFK